MRHYGGSHPYTPKRAVPVNHFELGSSGAAGQVRMASETQPARQPATAAATCAVAMSLILAPILAPAFVSQPTAREGAGRGRRLKRCGLGPLPESPTSLKSADTRLIVLKTATREFPCSGDG